MEERQLTQIAKKIEPIFSVSTPIHDIEQIEHRQILMQQSNNSHN